MGTVFYEVVPQQPPIVFIPQLTNATMPPLPIVYTCVATFIDPLTHRQGILCSSILSSASMYQQKLSFYHEYALILHA